MDRHNHYSDRPCPHGKHLPELTVIIRSARPLKTVHKCMMIVCVCYVALPVVGITLVDETQLDFVNVDSVCRKFVLC
jgi:hypothetical protein